MKAVGPEIFARGRQKKDAPITFYIAVVSDRDAKNPTAEAKRLARRARRLGYKRVLKRHTDWWHRFWKRSWVALPDATQERPWYWGLYRAASARRPGKIVPPYSPPWNASNCPGWVMPVKVS